MFITKFKRPLLIAIWIVRLPIKLFDIFKNAIFWSNERNSVRKLCVSSFLLLIINGYYSVDQFIVDVVTAFLQKAAEELSP